MLPVDLSFLRTFRRGPARRGRLIASGALSQMRPERSAPFSTATREPGAIALAMSAHRCPLRSRSVILVPTHETLRAYTGDGTTARSRPGEDCRLAENR